MKKVILVIVLFLLALVGSALVCTDNILLSIIGICVLGLCVKPFKKLIEICPQLAKFCEED